MSSDARTHFQGPLRSVSLYKVCTAGSGAIAKEGDAEIQYHFDRRFTGILLIPVHHELLCATKP